MKNTIFIKLFIIFVFYIELQCSNLIIEPNIIHIFDITNEYKIFKGFKNHIFCINFITKEISIFRDVCDNKESECIYKLFSDNINIVSKQLKNINSSLNCNSGEGYRYIGDIGIEDKVGRETNTVDKYGTIKEEEDTDLKNFSIKIINVEFKRNMEYFFRVFSEQDFTFCGVNILSDIIYWTRIFDISLDLNFYNFLKSVFFNLIDSNEFVKKCTSNRSNRDTTVNKNLTKDTSIGKDNANNLRFHNSIYNVILLYEFLKYSITDKTILYSMFEFDDDFIFEKKNSLIFKSYIRFTDDILIYVLNLLKSDKFRNKFSYLLNMCQISEIIFNFINFRYYNNNLNLLVEALPESIEKISLNDVENCDILFLHLQSINNKYNLKKICVFDKYFLLSYLFYMKDFKNIQEIRILSVRKSQNDFDSLNIYDHIFTNLKILYLSIRWLPDNNFLKIVSEFNCLTEFYLSINIFISYNDFLNVLFNIVNGNLLKSLKICILKTNITNVFIYLKFFKELENICLECNETANLRSYTRLNTFQYSNLKKIQFVNLRLTKNEYLFVLQLPNLLKVSLKYCNVQDFDITDTDMKNISSSINFIHIQNTNIINHFYKILHKFTALNELYIYETIIPTMFLSNFHTVNFRNLQIFKIFDCKIFGIHNLNTSFPNLQEISINIPLYMSRMSFSEYIHIFTPEKVLKLLYSGNNILSTDTILFSKMKNLRTLKIISSHFLNSKISDIFVKDFGYKLRELVLIEIIIPQSVIHHIFKLKNLQSINLSLSTIHSTKPIYYFNTKYLSTLIISGIHTSHITYNYILEIVSQLIIFQDFPIQYIV